MSSKTNTAPLQYAELVNVIGNRADTKIPTQPMELLYVPQSKRVDAKEERLPTIVQLGPATLKSLSDYNRNTSEHKLITTASPKRVGHLALYIGTMSVGKTTRAVEQATQFSQLDFKTAYITHSISNNRVMPGGCKNKFTSHNPSNIHLDEAVASYCATRIADLDLQGYGAVVIDEAQFFGHLVEDVNDLVAAGKYVQVYGLGGNFERKRFGSITDLIPNADTFEQMTAKCRDCLADPNVGFRSAAFARRNNDNKELISVGNLDEYSAVCRKHHTCSTR